MVSIATQFDVLTSEPPVNRDILRLLPVLL